MRPTGPIPAGWKGYSGGTPPFAIAHPPDWSVEEDQQTVTFSHPNGTTGVLISALRHPGGSPSLRALRDDYFDAVTTECEDAQQSGDGELVYGGVLFSSTGTECRLADQRLWFFMALGVQGQIVRAILTIETTERLNATVDTTFEPMLATLNFGGPVQASASPSPSARPQPTATRPAATATPAGLQPRGPIPVGWRSYVGSAVPFAIAYPPDWRADTANEVQGHVNFVAPDGITTVQIRQAGDLTATLGIDRLRDLYMEELGKQCGTEARAAGYNTFDGVRFAALRIDCTAGGKTIDLYYGTGIKDGQEWTISLIAPAGAWEAAAGQFFGPIIDTLDIADLP